MSKPTDAETTDITGGVIPYKNMPALIGYYVGIVSLIPVLHFVFAPLAIILGIIGLVIRRNRPAAKGSLHAIVAIVCGVLSSVIWCGLLALTSGAFGL
ncbi:MAG: hypothetical protein NXI22_03235 [bacterium]|nr:hypothetical protein [bacterium]